MAVTATLYDTFRLKLLSLVDAIDFAADDIRVALVTSVYVPDRAADEFWSTPQAQEAVGVGYTADGVSLTTPVIGIDATGHFGVFTADDVTWATATVTARYGVLYKDTGDPSTSPLIGYVDFGADESSVAADFILNWALAAAGGVVKI